MYGYRLHVRKDVKEYNMYIEFKSYEFKFLEKLIVQH